VDVGKNLTFVEFSGIFGLVESSEFLRRGVDISGNLRLVGLKALLLITGGSK
jgi:hypothetical protein